MRFARWLTLPLALAGCLRAQQVARPEFQIEEATVTSIHRAFQSGQLTCAQLVRMYLDRISAYDAKGPALNAIITVNPMALGLAAQMDQKYKANPSSVGSLHCIPVILKDNFDTFDMPTSGGNVTLRNSIPLKDAFAVKKIRDAGTIILAKANLSEFASSGVTVSGLKGQTLNPYDLKRTPGGSSGGTGASIAANFATLGTGSDTGQSIRSPASANNLVGLRPTRGLISRNGVIPLSLTQDEIGPITRTVEDAARLLQVMVGYDPEDPITAFEVGRVPKSYLASLDANGLKGARIGVMMNMFGKEAAHAEVNRVTEDAIRSLQKLGATTVRFTLPGYEDLEELMTTSTWEERPALDAYLARLGPNAPARSMAEIVAKGGIHPLIEPTLKRELAAKEDDPVYKEHLLAREKLRVAVVKAMADMNLDAIFYPHRKRLVALVGEAQTERNGTLSNGTGFPAIDFQGGFSQPTATAPQGVPVGVELLGREYSEPLLLKYAFAFEQGTKHRRPPLSTPPL